MNSAWRAELYRQRAALEVDLANVDKVIAAELRGDSLTANDRVSSPMSREARQPSRGRCAASGKLEVATDSGGVPSRRRNVGAGPLVLGGAVGQLAVVGRERRTIEHDAATLALVDELARLAAELWSEGKLENLPLQDAPDADCSPSPGRDLRPLLDGPAGRSVDR